MPQRFDSDTALLSVESCKTVYQPFYRQARDCAVNHMFAVSCHVGLHDCIVSGIFAGLHAAM